MSGYHRCSGSVEIKVSSPFQVFFLLLFLLCVAVSQSLSFCLSVSSVSLSLSLSLSVSTAVSVPLRLPLPLSCLCPSVRRCVWLSVCPYLCLCLSLALGWTDSNTALHSSPTRCLAGFWPKLVSAFSESLHSTSSPVPPPPHPPTPRPSPLPHPLLPTLPPSLFCVSPCYNLCMVGRA